MERLTKKREADQQRANYEKRLKQGYPRNIPEERFLRLADYEDIGLNPEEIKMIIGTFHESDRAELDELRAILRAKHDGRLFIAPVKVGDMLWPVCWDQVAKEWIIYDEPERVNEVGSKGFFVACCYEDPEAPDEFHPYEDLGREYFVSREVAEAAVAEMDGGGNHAED